MRKLILFIATSLDGYIAGPKGEIDWLMHDQDYGYHAFYAGIDTVLMGHKTWEVSLGFDENPFPGAKVFVFTRTPRAADARAGYVSGNIAAFIADLKRAPGKNLWLVGGGEIVAECLRHDLIDEFHIFVHPIILGGGRPLFPPPLPRRALRVVNGETFNSGLVRLSFERA